jgi:hypothetical protein
MLPIVGEADPEMLALNRNANAGCNARSASRS